MKSGKSFSSRKGGGSGRGRSGGAKKTVGKKTGSSKNFSSSRTESKPFGKRDDRDEKPDRDRPKSFERFGERKDFKKPFDKKFSGRAKPFEKRDDRDERPDRPKSFERSGERKDYKKPFDKKFTSRAKPFGKRDDRDEKPDRDRPKSFERSGERKDYKKPFDKKFSGRAKPFGKRDERDEKPGYDRPKSFERPDERKDKKPFDRKFSSAKSGSAKSFFGKRDDRDERPGRDRTKSFERTEERKEFNPSKPDDRTESFRPTPDGKDFVKVDRPGRKRKNDESSSGPGDRKWNRKSGHEFYGDQKKTSRGVRHENKERTESLREEDGSIRLNKYISNSGICSRREADDLITAGVVSVNGEIMTQLGYKVKPGDEVKYNNETLRTEKLVYILVNKPKDFITTVDDPQDRKTVMWLIRDACKERVYPVGRLDRNTTGVLLFTNDGELAKKLTHPSFEIQKIYQVELDSPLKSSDMEQIANGITLEDGFIKVDDIAYAATGQDKSVVGVEIHSGKNRIVRRIFEQLGYFVKKLDRVYFAGLSKKDLPRGRWRFLTPIEVSNLKMMTGNKKMRKYYEA